jgi:hypothetical protein
VEDLLEVGVEKKFLGVPEAVLAGGDEHLAPDVRPGVAERRAGESDLDRDVLRPRAHPLEPLGPGVLHLRQLVVEDGVEVVVADQLLVRDAVGEPAEQVVGDDDDVPAEDDIQLALLGRAGQLDDPEVARVLPLGGLLRPDARLDDLRRPGHDGASAPEPLARGEDHDSLAQARAQESRATRLLDDKIHPGRLVDAEVGQSPHPGTSRQPHTVNRGARRFQ